MPQNWTKLEEEDDFLVTKNVNRHSVQEATFLGISTDDKAGDQPAALYTLLVQRCVC
jgi:hypothetical protein